MSAIDQWIVRENWHRKPSDISILHMKNQKNMVSGLRWRFSLINQSNFMGKIPWSPVKISPEIHPMTWCFNPFPAHRAIPSLQGGHRGRLPRLQDFRGRRRGRALLSDFSSKSRDMSHFLGMSQNVVFSKTLGCSNLTLLFQYKLGFLFWLEYWKSVGMMKFPIYGKIKIQTTSQWFQWLQMSRICVSFGRFWPLAWGGDASICLYVPLKEHARLHNSALCGKH